MLESRYLGDLEQALTMPRERTKKPLSGLFK
jgi:hypothetical protein